MHGKTDWIHHDNQGLFAGLENPLQATRYHSLVIQPDTLHPDFVVCAWSDAPDGSREIMGIRHREYPLFGLQFHPESFLTRSGTKLLERFLETAQAPRAPALDNPAPALDKAEDRRQRPAPRGGRCLFVA